jgi:hypothetical protein
LRAAAAVGTIGGGPIGLDRTFSKQEKTMDNGNARAFPSMFEVLQQNPECDIVRHLSTGGLTKREHFAALALQGLAAARSDPLGVMATRDLAFEAVGLADALLAELQRPRPVAFTVANDGVNYAAKP